jgi:surface antigen/peptidoglycan hydrolase CwlO-like protein
LTNCGRLVRSVSKNKTMSKKSKKSNQIFNSGRKLLLLSVIGLIAGSSLVYADQYDTQIQSLKTQNAQSQSALSQLQQTAGSYQGAINALQSQIAGIQQLISSNQAKQASLQQQIIANQQEIAQKKSGLSDDLKTMYVDGQMTTIEELATSKNLSDYVDKEQWRTAVQDQLDATIQQISALQIQLQTQQAQVSQLLQAQQAQQSQLDTAQAQESQLLTLNVDQQNQYNQQISSNNSQITKLQAEKVAALEALEGSSASSGGSGTGGYPWANAPCPLGAAGGATCGDYDWGYPGDPYDPYGYQYRNCTSYVAWRIANTSTSPIIGQLISQLGNAAQWPGRASAEGVSVSYGNDPQVGDAAVDPGVADGQGHVMYVTAVNGDGSIDVSQYNVVPGAYSTGVISAGAASGLDFIHFPGM